MLVPELEELCSPALVLADISNKPRVGLNIIRDDIDSIPRKERQTFVCISFPLLQLLDLLYPLSILALRSCLDQTFRKVFDITADTEIDGNVLSDLRAVAVDVDLRSGKREFLSPSRRTVRESYADRDNEISFCKCNG